MHRFFETRALFGINQRTLYRWMHRAKITPHDDPVDHRRKYFDNDQLVKLARLHQRVLYVDTEAAKLDHIAQLERRIEELEKNLGNKKGPKQQ